MPNKEFDAVFFFSTLMLPTHVKAKHKTGIKKSNTTKGIKVSTTGAEAALKGVKGDLQHEPR